MTVVTQGFPETVRAFGKLNKGFSKDVRKRLKAAVEPVRQQAEVLAGQQVRNLGGGDPWTGIRTGGGTKLVYVAPKQKGRAARHNPKRRRPNLAPHILKAMESAAERGQQHVQREVDLVLEKSLEDWSRA